MSSFNIKASVTVTLSIYLSLFSTLCTGTTTTVKLFNNCGSTRYVSDDDEFILKIDGDDWYADDCEMRFVNIDYYDMLYAETDSVGITDSDVSLTLRSSSSGITYVTERTYTSGYYSSTGAVLMNTYLRIRANRLYSWSGSSLQTEIKIYTTVNTEICVGDGTNYQSEFVCDCRMPRPGSCPFENYGVSYDYIYLPVGAIVGISAGSLAGLIIFIVIIVVCVKQCGGTRGRVIAAGAVQPITTTVNTHYPVQPPGGSMTYGYPMTTVPAHSTNIGVAASTPGQDMPYQPVNSTAVPSTTGVAPLATSSSPDGSSDAPPKKPAKY